MEKFKKRLGVVSGEAYILGLLVFVFLNLKGEWFAKDQWFSFGVWFVAAAFCLGEISFAIKAGLENSHFLKLFSSMLVGQSVILVLVIGVFVLFCQPGEQFFATSALLHPTSGMLCFGVLLLGVSYLYEIIEKSYATHKSPHMLFAGFELGFGVSLMALAVYLGGTIYLLDLTEETLGLVSELVFIGVVVTIIMGIVKLIAKLWQRVRLK